MIDFTGLQDHHFNMIITVDNAGRVVIPKSQRNRLGIFPGSQLELLETQDGIVLTVPSPNSRLVLKEGALLYQGKILPGAEKALEEEREMMMRRIS